MMMVMICVRRGTAAWGRRECAGFQWRNAGHRREIRM